MAAAAAAAAGNEVSPSSNRVAAAHCWKQSESVSELLAQMCRIDDRYEAIDALWYRLDDVLEVRWTNCRSGGNPTLAGVEAGFQHALWAVVFTDLTAIVGDLRTTLPEHKRRVWDDIVLTRQLPYLHAFKSEDSLARVAKIRADLAELWRSHDLRVSTLPSPVVPAMVSVSAISTSAATTAAGDLKMNKGTSEVLDLDRCILCVIPARDKCRTCLESSRRGGGPACGRVVGVCGHAYHRHCIDRALTVTDRCPTPLVCGKYAPASRDEERALEIRAAKERAMDAVARGKPHQAAVELHNALRDAHSGRLLPQHSRMLIWCAVQNPQMITRQWICDCPFDSHVATPAPSAP
jgi:hypothetical protein